MPDQFTEQLKKLEALRHAVDSAALEEFDEEAEQLILQRFGEATNHLEAYELAVMGEADTIVNMPQSAQEDATQDLFHMSIEQRRQVLEGCLADTAAPAPAPTPMPKAAKKPRSVKKKKKPAKKKAGAAGKAAGKSGKKSPVKKKKPAAARKKKAGSAKKKRVKRK
jgi:hypothetical protein